MSKMSEINKSNKSNKVKLVLSYHKKDVLFKDEVLTPVHAGRGLDDPGSSQSHKSKSDDWEWMRSNMGGDNDGDDNISVKNAWFNEMTAIYWAWKNYVRLGDPEFVGFMHYRRHFFFSEFSGSSESESGSGSKKESRSVRSVIEREITGENGADYLRSIGYSPQNAASVLEGCDFICPKPQWRYSLYEHYKRNHRIEDLDLTIQILNEKFPEMARHADEYLSGSDAYFCNMFVMRKDLFFDYAEFVFAILFELEKRTDLTEKRTFVSEWLTGIYLTSLIARGYKYKCLPTVMAEGFHKIPVMLAADACYAMPLAVTLTSILENAKPFTHYDFLILTPKEGLGGAAEAQLTRLTMDYPKCSIRFVPVKGGNFENAAIVTPHLSKVAFYRLLAAELFPEHDKMIYLDVDTIVEEDLSALYRISLNGYYVAGVKAPGYFYPPDWKNRKSAELGVPIDQYINSGVLLMDLNLFRKNNLTERFIELSGNGYSSEDQDVINIACHGQIKHLHLRYNVMTKYLEDGSTENEKMRKVFPPDIVSEALSRPSVIHYANRIKPWSDPTLPWADRWWKYAAISPYAAELGANTPETVKYVMLAPPFARFARFSRCMREHGFLYTCKHAAKYAAKNAAKSARKVFSR